MIACSLLCCALSLFSSPHSYLIAETRGLVVYEEGESLRIQSGKKAENHSYSWVTLRDYSDGGSGDFSQYSSVAATIENQSDEPVETMFWVCGSRGWSAVGDFAKLKAGESRKFTVNLWETYPDRTAKLDPRAIDKIQLMTRGAGEDVELVIHPFYLEGTPGEHELKRKRTFPPPVLERKPSPGKRVKWNDGGEGPYSVLYLPPSWKSGKKFPVIVEYPGNIFFNERCYSTGRPDQCVIGYGMSEGKSSIVLSLPFVDSAIPDVVESGFGNPEETVSYAKEAIERVIDEFGGERENLVLTGFSRGSIACGFIGLRDDEIAAYWKGIHGCQHYDGSKWRESNMEEAVLRAKRFRGEAIFQTDNSEEKYAPVMRATDPGVEWTWVSSGLGFHATSMFLDDRPSTLQLRGWYRDLVSRGEDSTGSGR